MVDTRVKLATGGFLSGLFLNIFLYVDPWFFEFSYSPSLYIKPLEILCAAFLLFHLGLAKLKIIVTGYILGFLFTTGFGIWHLHSCVFGWYMCVLAFFHFSEFVTTGLSNPSNLSFDSFLVNHSMEYGVAAAASWGEFWLENWLLPSINKHPTISCLGVCVCLLGEIIRKLAMLHAGTNFNHIVQGTKDENHKLITTGIYSWCRHPSYVGWFLWSVGTQMILVNPACFVAYSVVSFMFFRGRIYVEEYTLLMFFGDEYANYREQVGTGIPGIKGYDGPRWGEKSE